MKFRGLKNSFVLGDIGDRVERVKRRLLRVDRPLRSWNTYVQGKRNGACVMMLCLNSETDLLLVLFLPLLLILHGKEI